MTRLLLVVLLAALAAACTNGNASDPGSSHPGSADKDAKAFKTAMDAEAEALLPDLMSSLGGELAGMQATFYQRSGFDLWDYVASGGIAGTDVSTTDSLAASAVTLEDHGYTVETDDAKRRVTGTKDGIGVIIEASLLQGESTGLNLRISNHGAIDDGDDYAEDIPPEDYLAYLP